MTPNTRAGIVPEPKTLQLVDGRNNREITRTSAAVCLFLLGLFSLLRYSKHWIVLTIGFGGYTLAEAASLAVMAWVGWRLFLQLPVQSAPVPKMHSSAFPSLPKALDPLLTLRAYACMCVLLGHSFLLAFPPAGLKAAIRGHVFYTHFLPEPWVGVWIFFTLSGYLMGKGFFFGRYQTTTLGAASFYRNRLLRILPMYFAATLLVAAFAKPEFFYPRHIFNAINLLGFFDFVGDPVVPNQALWSVGTELEFYLFVPFLFILLRGVLTRTGSIFFAYFFLISLGLETRVLVWRYLPENIYGGSFLGNFDFFFCGFTLSALMPLWSDHARGRHRLAVGLAGLAIYYMIASYFCQHGRMLEEKMPQFLWQTILPSLTILMTSAVILLMETGSLNREAGWVRWIIKRSQILGILTYAIYVWQEPILVAGHAALAGARISLGQSLGMIALNFCKIFAVAYLFYYWIEKYYDKKKVVYANPGASPS